MNVTTNMIILGFDFAMRDGKTDAQRVAEEFFDDDFSTCLQVASNDKHFDDAVKALKSLPDVSRLIVTNRQKRHLQAFAFWVESLIRCGNDSEMEAFHIANIPRLLAERENYVDYWRRADTMLKAGTMLPRDFTASDAWRD